MKFLVTAYSNWEKPFSFVFDNFVEAKAKKIELKNQQYFVEVEEIN